MVDFAQIHSAMKHAGHGQIVPGEYFPLAGGLDLATPPLQIKPGTLIGCLNYEAKLLGGYQSIAGYERYDGRTKASEASYWLVNFAGAVPANDPVVGASIAAASGGAAVVLAFLDADNNGAGTLVLGRLTGTWTAGTTITSGSFAGVQSGVISKDGANNDADDATYTQLATADQRALILQVPGEGRVLGTVIYRGIVYAFRNAVGSATAKFYQATSAGWVEITLGTRVKFSTGAVAGIAAGDTLTGASSAAHGTVRRVVVQTGTFAAGTAAGYVILSAVTGTFTNGENLQVAAATRGVAVGASSPQTLLPNGRYEFRVHNFYGSTGTLRLYGCDGVNKAFEFQDGASGFFYQIDTGMVIDAPLYCAIFQSALYLAFPGGSIQHSSVNDAVVWDAVTGAAEIGIGDEPTGFLEQTQTLFIFSRTKSFSLSLNTYTANLLFNTFEATGGCLPHTAGNIGSGLYLDDQGFSVVTPTQNFGDFSRTPVSLVINPLTKELLLKAVSSVVVKQKSLYRVFFDDGQFISITVSGSKVLGFMRCDYAIPVRTVFSDKDPTGKEFTVFGSDDGYVYVADSGTSFDGAEMITFMRLPFNHSKSPGRIKRYRRANFDVSTDGACILRFAVDYTYARPDVTSDPTRTIAVLAGGGFWDISKWDQFRWNAGYVGEAPIKLEGEGENISFLVSSQSATQQQHSIDGVMLRYSLRRLERRTVS